MLRRALIATVALMPVLAWSQAPKAPAASASKTSSTPPAKGPGWTIVVESQPKIRANYPTGIRAKVTDAKGAPVGGASVEYVVNMIDMDHGEHKSPATMSAPGIYDGKVNFFMVGAWMLEVRARRGTDTVSHKQRFDIPPG